MVFTTVSTFCSFSYSTCSNLAYDNIRIVVNLWIVQYSIDRAVCHLGASSHPPAFFITALCFKLSIKIQISFNPDQKKCAHI